MTALLALAFGAGMLAPVNPCGFAVLPAFLAYATGAHQSRTGAHASVPARLAGGLHAGLALTAGFAGTFTLIGLLLALGLRSLIGVVPWLAAVVGGILAVLGVMTLAGARLPLRLPSTRPRMLSRGPIKMVGFGVGYALASASCTLAILLAVVTQALATSNLSGVLVVFGAYAAGSATLLLTLALFAAFASTAISRYLRRLLPHMHKITGAVLVVSGGYLLLYWLPQLVGQSQPGLNPLTGLVGTVSLWITAHQVPITITVLTLLAATTLVIVLPRRRKADNSVDADCCPARDHEPDPRR